MNQNLSSEVLAQFSRPALLVTEAAEDFDALHAQLVHEIAPCGFIERMHVGEFSKIVWEMLRLHRCKAAMINTAFRPALKKLLLELGSQAAEPISYGEADALAFAWFTDPTAKDQVAEILTRFHLDDTAIEAEAIRSLAAELELIDRMLMTLEARRNRALRGIAEYRESFALTVRKKSDGIIEAEAVRQLTAEQSPG
jgi:hypothetical protein